MKVYTLEIGVAHEGGGLDDVAHSVETLKDRAAWRQFVDNHVRTTVEDEDGIHYTKIVMWEPETTHMRLLELVWWREKDR